MDGVASGAASESASNRMDNKGTVALRRLRHDFGGWAGTSRAGGGDLWGGGRWGRHSTVPLQLARRQSGAYKGWSGHDVYMVYSLASTGVFGFLAYFLRG